MGRREQQVQSQDESSPGDQNIPAFPRRHVEVSTTRNADPRSSNAATVLRQSESISSALAGLQLTSSPPSTPLAGGSSPENATLRFATQSYHAFIQSSQQQCIEQSVAAYRQVLAATSPHSPAFQQCQYLLASALICRYRNTDARISDLAEGIELAENAAGAASSAELSLRASSLQGWGYYMRYVRTGHVPDVTIAVELLERVAAQVEARERWLVLLRLSLAITAQYMAYAGEEHIIRAEQMARDALLHQHPPAAEPMLQDGLSRVLYTKYRNSPDRQHRDILEASEAAERALRATPATHAHYAAYAQNRCRLYIWCLPSGKVAEDAMTVGESAFRRTPNGYRRRFSLAQAVSNVSDMKTSRDGKKEDLEEAMWWARVSAQTPELHNKPTYETGLCRWLIRRFEQYGQPSDIDSAIDTLRPYADGVTTQIIDNIQFARHYIVFAYFSRFRWHGDERDLEESIRYATLCVESPSQGMKEHETALALYRSCFERYKRKSNLDDLEYALKKTLEIIPQSDVPWHAMQPSDTWSVLGDMHFCRYRELAEEGDFEQGVAWCHRILNNHASALIDKTQAMHLLAGGFAARAETTHSLSDLQQAVLHAERCAEMVPPGHALRADFVTHLADLYAKRYERTGNEADLQKALDNYRSATVDTASVVKHRFQAAAAYASLAHHAGRLETALRAYVIATELLPRLAWLGMDHESLFRNLLSGATTLACDAAACACALGRYEQAVVLLEQGRGVFWQQQMSILSQNQQLLREQPGIAAELQQIGRSLEVPTQAGNDPLTGIRNRRQLAERWDALVARIRKIDGFSNFLQPMTFEELREPAAHGTPVFLIASNFGCSALIITRAGPIRYVPLSGTSRDRLKSLALVMHKAVLAPQDAIGTQYMERLIRTVINELWRDVAAPIWAVLSTLNLGPLPRVWWVPTGVLGLLPMHAAVPADPDAPGLPDLVTSSYVVLLQNLVWTFRNLRDQPSPKAHRVLMVAQPMVDQFVQLPSVAEELKILRQTLPPSSLLVLDGPAASVNNVTRALGRESWIHFACHGHQDQVSPLDSCLVLADGKLKLSQMIANRFENPNSFAFLSACHTARGFPELPDEMLHITAALDFAGFGSVVGSGWAIADKDAPLVASRFYRYLTSEGQSLDPGRTAEALRVAVTALRRAGVPAHRWAPFLHVGR